VKRPKRDNAFLFVIFHIIFSRTSLPSLINPLLRPLTSRASTPSYQPYRLFPLQRSCRAPSDSPLSLLNFKTL
jgi:hypothetical protein